MKTEYFEYLKNYENNLFTALKLDYSRNLPTSVLQKMSEIFKAIFNKESGLLNGCSRCALRDLKSLASAYFEAKESMEKLNEELKKVEQVENETEPKSVTNSKSTTKGRKPNNKATNKNKK